MSQYTVQPGCVSVKMFDGTVYKADRRGHIQIDNPRHMHEVATSSTLGNGYLEPRRNTFETAAGKECSRCLFHAFAWSATCPRCGEDISGEETA